MKDFLRDELTHVCQVNTDVLKVSPDPSAAKFLFMKDEMPLGSYEYWLRVRGEGESCGGGKKAYLGFSLLYVGLSRGMHDGV
jgi:hypothetical protein